MGVITSKLIVMLIDELSAPARGLGRVVNNLQAQAKANAMQMNEMRGKMVDAAGAAWALAQGIAKPVQQAIAFESAMADVGKVSGFSREGLNAFGLDLRRLATSEIPMAVTELAALAESAAASGIQDSELLDFTRMTAKAALAWGVSGGQAGEDLAKIKTALRLTVDETMLYADAINMLADTSASSAPDLTDYTRRVAAQGEFFGYTKEQTLAFGSAMISAGAESEVAATSFRNMGRALTKGASATKSQRTAFRALGLDSTKVAKRMQEDAVGTTLDVIKRLGNLPAETRASVMGDLFGDEARALAPLLSNLGLLETTLASVSDESKYAGSVSAEFAQRAATTEFNMQRLKNQIDGVALAIGNALLPAVNGVAAAIGPMLIAMADWAAAHPQIVQAIVAVVGGLVALRVAAIATRWAFLFMKGGIIDGMLAVAKSAATMLGLINPMNQVKGAAFALRAALLFSGVGAVVAAIAAAGLWIYNNWNGLGAFFAGFGTGVTAALAPIMPAIQPIIDGGSKILEWVTGLLGPVDASAEDWRGWGEAAGTGVGNAVMAIATKGAEIIAWFKALPGEIMAGLSGMYDVGLKIVQQMWDGAVAKFDEMLVWFASWPSKILEKIGKIDFGSMFMGPSGPISSPIQGHGGNIIYPIGQAPGVAGARAAGGSIAGGQTYLVGEYGPELVTPNRSGFVHTAAKTAGMMGGAAPSISFGDIIVQGGSNPQATAEAVLAMIEQRVKEAISGIYADIEYAG